MNWMEHMKSTRCMRFHYVWNSLHGCNHPYGWKWSHVWNWFDNPMDEMWHGWNCICEENGHHPYWLICMHVIKLHPSHHNFYPYFYYIYAFNFINIIKFHSCGMFLNCHPHGCVLTFFHVMDVIDVSNYICCANFHQPILSMSLVTPMDHQYLPTFSPCKSINYFISCILESFINSKFVLFITFIHLINSWFSWSVWWISCTMMNFTHVIKFKKRGSLVGQEAGSKERQVIYKVDC